MTSRKPPILILIIISVFTMNFRCEKDIQGRPLDYTFLIPVDIYPLKKSYSVADTIWIETDITSKILFDSKINQNVLVDTGQITFAASFNEFGTNITNPPNGFCDVITINGTNNNRKLAHWATYGSIPNVGCGQLTYKYVTFGY